MARIDTPRSGLEDLQPQEGKKNEKIVSRIGQGTRAALLVAAVAVGSSANAAEPQGGRFSFSGEMGTASSEYLKALKSTGDTAKVILTTPRSEGAKEGTAIGTAAAEAEKKAYGVNSADRVTITTSSGAPLYSAYNRPGQFSGEHGYANGINESFKSFLKPLPLKADGTVDTEQLADAQYINKVGYVPVSGSPNQPGTAFSHDMRGTSGSAGDAGGTGGGGGGE